MLIKMRDESLLMEILSITACLVDLRGGVS